MVGENKEETNKTNEKVNKKELDMFNNEQKKKENKEKQKEIEKKSGIKCDYCDKTLLNNLGYHGHMSTQHTESYYSDHPEKTPPKRRGRKLKEKKLLKKEEKEKKPNKKRIAEINEEDYDLQSEDPFPHSEKPKKIISSKKTLNMAAREQYMAQLLIDHGFAKDLADVNRRSLRLAFSMMNVGGVAGMYKDFNNDGKQSVMDMLEDLKRRKLEDMQLKQYEAELNNMSGGQGGKKMDMGEAMILMSMMNQNKNQSSGNESFVQMLEVLKFMQGQNQNRGNNITEIAQLMKIMSPPQNNQQANQQVEILKFMLENQKENNNMSDILTFLRDKDKNDGQNLMRIQKLRDEHQLNLLNNKIEQLQDQIKNTPKGDWDPEVFVQKIEAIKKVSDTIGGGEREPQTLDQLGEIIKAGAPAFTEILKTKQMSLEKQMQDRQFAQQKGGQRSNLSERQASQISEEEIMQHHQQGVDVEQPPPQPKKFEHIMHSPTKRKEEGEPQSLIPKTTIELPGSERIQKNNVEGV